MKNMLFILLFVSLSACEVDNSYEPNILKFDIRVNGKIAEYGELYIIKAFDHNPLAKDAKGEELADFGGHEVSPISINDISGNKDFYVPATENRAYFIYARYYDSKTDQVWINTTRFIYKNGVKIIKLNIKI